MKAFYISFLNFLLLAVLSLNNLVSQTLDSTNLPIILLDTYGQTILDNPRITASMGIIDNGFGNMNHINDPFTDYNGKISIEIRGSTSQQYPKKAYGLSTVDSAGLNLNFPVLGMPAEHDWILYAPYPDKTMMRNTLTYYLANNMGHYASRTKFAELMINGNYRGVYELQEKIKRDSNRVNIATLLPADTLGDELTGGYIIKVDKVTGSSTTTFTSNFDPNVYFQFHDPEDIQLLPVQKNYIISYVDSFETALSSPNFADTLLGYRKYASVKSFIDFFLLQELGRTVDGYRSSCFLHKDKNSNGGKLKMGPMWDFNLSFGNADYCSGYDTTGWQYQFNNICPGFVPEVPFWWSRLLQDTSFSNEVRCRWNYLRSNILRTDNINNWIDSVAGYLNQAQQRNYIQWPILGIYVNWEYYVGNSFQDEIDYLKMWIEKRSVWMDNNLPSNSNCGNISVQVPENHKPTSITIAPNPNSGEFKITFNKVISEGRIQIYNIFGEKISDEPLKQTSKKEININPVSAGIYMATIFDGTNTITKKIIVQ